MTLTNLTNGGSPLPLNSAVYRNNNTLAIFTPSPALVAGKRYEINISTGITDTDGLSLAEPWTSRFDTSAVSSGTTTLQEPRRYMEVASGFDPYVGAINGVLALQAVDAASPGRGIPAMVLRSYRSSSPGVGIFGRSWRCSLNQKMVLTPAGLEFHDSDGRTYLYERDPGKTDHFLPKSGEGLRDEFFETTKVALRSGGSGPMQVVSGSFYVQRKLDGTKLVYDGRTMTPQNRSAYLSAIIDNNGNNIEISRDVLEPLRILSIRNDISRPINFTYNNQNLVSQITDVASNRTWSYEYDSTDKTLLRVLTPETTFVSESGSPVTGSRVVDYTYYPLADPTDPTEPARLLSIQDPRRNLVMSFYYDDANKVFQYDWGLGTVFFEYSTATKVTTKIDPMGNLAEAAHNAEDLIS